MAATKHPWDGTWILGERLGKGGQGVTHLVTRKGDSKQEAALKILKNNKGEQARARMYREVVNLEVLSHAGGAVPRVLEHNTKHFRDTAIELFVVMDYIPRRTLREIVDDRGPLPLELAIGISLNICQTIKLAHTYSILHRDLKPENIIVRDVDAADVVIVDYGLSFNTDDPDVTVTEETFRNRFLDLPETNTPGGNRRDPRSDVTAACGIFYYLLTGHVPGQLQGGDGRPPHLRPGYSLKRTLGQLSTVGQLDILFNRGFTPNIDNRFQTVDELCERIALLSASAASTEPEHPTAVAERASEVLRQRDRTTQLREFQQPAMELLQSIQQNANNFANKLGRFMLVVELVDNDGKQFPSRLDRVTPRQLKLQVNPAHHNHLRMVVYAVASRGEQCVILRRAYGRERGQDHIIPLGEYEELLWYDATGKPDLTPVHLNVRAWLNTAILELTDMTIAE